MGAKGQIEAEFAAILGQAEMARLRGLLEELGRRLDQGHYAEPKSGYTTMPSVRQVRGREYRSAAQAVQFQVVNM